MNNEGKKAGAGGVALAASAAVVILVPAFQCWLMSRENTRLQKQVLDTRETNKGLQRAVAVSYETKTSELVQTSRQVDELEDRLERNKELLGKTEDARQRLSVVKTLIEEHHRISQSLDEYRRLFPELFSGR